VILVLAALAILGCVVLAALGRAGEMAVFPGDSKPIGVDQVTPTDIALLRPPLALWGYNVVATEEALGAIARSVTARDAEIARLRQELDELQAGQPPGQGPDPQESNRSWAHGEVPAWPAPPEPGPDE
jgi:hypothetical protein